MRLEADLVLVGGRVLTWWDEVPEAEGLAVGRGRILAVGRNVEVRSWAGSGTTVLDAGNRLVLPGFVDSHTHLATVGSRPAALDLRGAASLEDVRSRVVGRARHAPPGAWILGRNWDESRWPVRRYPTRHDLDEAAAEHPVALTRVDMHMAVANSAALARLDPQGPTGVERDAEGHPTGVLKEEAAAALLALTQPDAATVTEGLPPMVAEAHRLGVTSVSDTVRPDEVRAYLGLHREARLPLRVNLMPRMEGFPGLQATGLSSGLGGPTLRLGPLKAFLDGSLGSRTAALTAPFADDAGNRGQLMYGEDEARDLLGRAAREGFQLALHAIGERGVDFALARLGEVQARGRRHRIEHLELPTEGHLKEAQRLGVVASMQPNFVGEWSRPGGMYEDRLGSERLLHNNPFRRVLDAGIPLAFGSDMMPFGPLYGIHWAVNAPFEDQRIPVEEALRAYTLGGAYATFEEDAKGSLEPGKLGDLVVLEKDPREQPEGIRDIPVHATVFGGAVVYRAP